MSETFLAPYPWLVLLTDALSPLIRAFAVISVVKCVKKEFAKMAIPLILQPFDFRGLKAKSQI